MTIKVLLVIRICMKVGRIIGLSFLLVIAAFVVYQAFENHITIDKCYELGYHNRYERWKKA